MHHLILMLPLIGIVVFWLMPLGSAIAAYLGIVLVSGLMYWAILRAIRKKPITGASGLVGARARIVSKLGTSDEAQYMVEADGELWSANSPDTLEPGEIVSIVRVDGIRLLVRHFASPQKSSPGTMK
jgi:membrane protein implicated in regulation of membrane protease activity